MHIKYIMAEKNVRIERIFPLHLVWIGGACKSDQCCWKSSNPIRIYRLALVVSATHMRQTVIRNRPRIFPF